MRLELIPVLLGVLVLAVAGGILYDAASPYDQRPHQERRRRQRAEIDTAGEWLVGLGVACLGISLIGNEVWRWTTLAVLSGIVLVVIGAILNRQFLREMLLFRGAARRSSGGIGRDRSMKLRIR
jgi:cell division protein FtsW (lipid II flippase)